MYFQTTLYKKVLFAFELRHRVTEMSGLSRKRENLLSVRLYLVAVTLNP